MICEFMLTSCIIYKSRIGSGDTVCFYTNRAGNDSYGRKIGGASGPYLLWA